MKPYTVTKGVHCFTPKYCKGQGGERDFLSIHEPFSESFCCGTVSHKGSFWLSEDGTRVSFHKVEESDVGHGAWSNSILERNCWTDGAYFDKITGRVLRFCHNHGSVMYFRVAIAWCKCCGKVTPTQENNGRGYRYNSPGKPRRTISIDSDTCTDCKDMEFCDVCNSWYKGYKCPNKMCRDIRYYTPFILWEPSNLKRTVRYMKGVGIKNHVKDRQRTGRYNVKAKMQKFTGQDLRELLLFTIKNTLKGGITISKANAVGRLAEVAVSSLQTEMLHHKYVEDITCGKQKAQLEYTEAVEIIDI